jgi:hypothetical protein
MADMTESTMVVEMADTMELLLVDMKDLSKVG